jgi:cytochrome c oxidase cbb3-type subunit 2
VKSNFNFFIGVFCALLVSWLGIVLGSNAQLGSLAPYDDGDGTTHPEWMPGVAAQGQLVYRDLGCASCHTQQVRRPSFGSDQARGWGDRQSVARDYIYQPAPQLGLQRVGPDLTNLADRKPSAMDADDLMGLLYAGIDGMPSYKFLFETRRIGSGAQPSDKALKLTGALKPKDGWEIVPTSRAESLVGYLVNLKTTFTYPEATPVAPPKPEGEASKPAAAPAATGTSGATGSTAASGSTGTTGASGTSGTSGASGASGATGTTASSGSTGATGASGATGGTGSSGATGASGASGATGGTAASGATGATAASGTSGASGATGSTGSTGASGGTGTTGTTGGTGTTGATGATGGTAATGGTK